MKINPFNLIHLKKISKIINYKIDESIGHFYDLEKTLSQLDTRPPSLNFELTNICNAKCVFCGYQYQERAKSIMSEQVFNKALADYIDLGGGDIFLTPIVGDSLLDPNFLNRVYTFRKEPKIRDIRLITNGILLDRFGIEEVVRSGINGIFISTAGFQEEMYQRVYRNNSYQRMRDNVLALLETRERLGIPLDITIGLRSDRPLVEVMKDPDFQPILKYKPEIDFTWSFYDFGGKIKESDLLGTMKMRQVATDKKTQPCKNLYDGPIVLPEGVVMACYCAAAMDAIEDLSIGNIMNESLGEIWTGSQRQKLIAQFEKGGNLNSTCSACTAYRNLDFYRSSKGRRFGSENEARVKGEKIDSSYHERLHY